MANLCRTSDAYSSINQNRVQKVLKKITEMAYGDPNLNQNANRLRLPTHANYPHHHFPHPTPSLPPGTLYLSLPFSLAFPDSINDLFLRSLLEIRQFGQFLMVG